MDATASAPTAPATSRRSRLPAWAVVAIAIAVVPWLAYWIAIDPASPRWASIDSLFLPRGPIVAVVAGAIAALLFVQLLRHWRAPPPPGDDAWIWQIVQRGGFYCLALYAGLATVRQFGEALVDHRVSSLVAPPNAGGSSPVVDLLALKSFHRVRIEQARWVGEAGQGRWQRESTETRR